MQGINRGKHLVNLNKKKQAHVSIFNFLFLHATKQPHYEPAVNVLSKGKGKSWWGSREGKEKLNLNVPEPATATRPESLTKIGLWSEIGYSLA